MRNPTPEVSCKYGAPLGRRSTPILDTDAGRISLQKIPLDTGGYDRGGAYWGIGQPLYCAQDQNGDTMYFRAWSRDSAKHHVLENHPDARFYR